MSWQIVNGQLGEVTGFEKVLPLGAYVESYFPENETGKMLACIDAMAECGMNLIYLRVSNDPACLALIESAINYNMKIGIECNGVSDEEAVALIGIENVAFLLNQDDQENTSEAECETRYKVLKAAFPSVPVYSTGYKTDSTSKSRRGWADIDAQQNYPTGQQADIIKHSIDVYTAAKNIASVNFANPQCYEGYEGVKPTKLEVMLMGLAALLRCKGLLWYSFFIWDHKNNKVMHNILDHPEWLEGVKIVCDFARENESLLLGE